jgi:hypothetical protein
MGYGLAQGIGNWGIPGRRKFGNEQYTGFKRSNGWMLNSEVRGQKSD